MYTSKHTHSQTMRAGLFAAFTGLSGMSMAPMLKMALMINPMVVPQVVNLALKPCTQTTHRIPRPLPTPKPFPTPTPDRDPPPRPPTATPSALPSQPPPPPPQPPPQALMITTGLFGTMTALSLFAKPGTALRMGVPLGGGKSLIRTHLTLPPPPP